MANYYELLDLKKDATNKDIKKAYFSKVKIYSPEKDPENFKQIRKAYETLYDEVLRKKYDDNFHDEKPYQNEFLKAIEYIDSYNGLKALDILKKLNKKYPNDINIELKLANAYFINGNTGNTTKVFKKLCEKHPTNQDIRLALADFYSNRAFIKKAKEQYLIAIDLNKNSPKAWDSYINFLLDNYNLDTVIEEAFNSAMAINKEMFLEYPDNYILGLNFSDSVDKKTVNEYVNCYFKGYSALPKLSKDHYEAIAYCISNFHKEFYAETAKNALDILLAYEYDLPEREDMITCLRILVDLETIIDDKDVSDFLRSLTMVIKADTGLPRDIILRFKIELIIIEIAEKLNKDLIYLQKNHPEYYNLNSVFYNKVLNPKQHKKLKEQYVKRFTILENKYPREFYGDDDDFDDDFDFDFDYY